MRRGTLKLRSGRRSLCGDWAERQKHPIITGRLKFDEPERFESFQSVLESADTALASEPGLEGDLVKLVEANKRILSQVRAQSAL